MNPTIDWHPAFQHKATADPQRCYELVQALSPDRTPVEVREALVQEARAPDCPAHPCFTWDDTEAAHKQRLAEAHRLINSLVIIKTEQRSLPQPFRAIEIVTKQKSGRRLRSTLDVCSKEEHTIEVLYSLAQQIARLREKVQRIWDEAHEQGGLRVMRAAEQVLNG